MVTMRVCILVLMLQNKERLDASSPEMTFRGTMFETNGSALLHFVCETSAVFLGCSVNFLKNGRSQESIRYDLENYTCYHSNEDSQGLCSPELCRCSNCHTFIWNYTLNSKSNRNNLSFECDGNIFANPKKFKGSAVLQLTKNKFRKTSPRITEYGRKQFLESPVVKKSSTTVSIQGNGKTCDDHEHDRTMVFVITVLVVFICIFVIVHTAIKTRNWFKKKTPIEHQHYQDKSEGIDVGSDNDRRPVNENDHSNQDRIELQEEHASNITAAETAGETSNNPLLDEITTDNEQPTSSCSETEDGASNIRLISNQQ